MKNCKNCQINYDSPLEKCLFCGDHLIEQSPSVYKYEPYKKKVHVFSLITKILFFLNLVAASSVLLIDYYVNQKLTWSIIVVVSNVYLALMSYNFYKRQTWQAHTIWFFVFTSIYISVLGHFLNEQTWAIDYALPGIIMLGLFIFSIFILIGKQYFFDNVIYIIIMSFFSLIPLLLAIIGVTTVSWPSYASFLYALLTLIGLFLFSHKRIKEDFKRRFHV